MVEVVFHIGAHKCATSSVQQGLASYAERTPGLAYLPPTRPSERTEGREPNPQLKALIRLAGRDDGPSVGAVVEGLVRLIEAEAGCERIVISDEYMLGPMPGLGWRFYPRAAALREALDGVARRFKVSVFLQSREPAAFLKSCHRFRVRFGLTLGYDAFLDRFALDTLSWTALGKTLFEGAGFDWRVLPLETLVDPARAEATAAALRFVLPAWDLADVPLASANPAFGPLMRAATLVLRRAGVHVPNALAGRPARVFGALDATIGAAEAEAAVAMIRGALDAARLPADETLAWLIHAQYLEERAPDGRLQALLKDRFAQDYASFRAAYAAEAGAVRPRSGLLSRLGDARKS